MSGAWLVKRDHFQTSRKLFYIEETMVNIPTPDELRKGAEARDEARLFTNPDVRGGMPAVATEYERLAKRAEEFDGRARVGADNDRAMENWRG